MRVYIYATEGMYQGLHGIYNHDVFEVDSFEEADEIGRDLAASLVEQYGLEEEYEDSSIDYESEYCCEFHKIREDIHLTIDELSRECSNCDRDTFIEKYCELEEFY